MKKTLLSLLFLLSGLSNTQAIPVDIQAMGGLALTSVGLWAHLHTEADLSTLKAFENISKTELHIDPELFQDRNFSRAHGDFCTIDEYTIHKTMSKSAGASKPNEAIQATKNGQQIAHHEAVNELRERYKSTPFFQKAGDATALLGFGIFLHAGFRLTKIYFNNNR